MGYGADYMHTPHMDRLAAGGIRFTRAYAQYALCRPSRNSVCSGVRPDRLAGGGKWVFRRALPDIVALPQLFKQHGYRTRMIGKILHHDGQDDPISFTEPSILRFGPIYAHPDNLDKQIVMDRAENFSNPLTEMSQVHDHAYRDGLYTLHAVDTLRRWSRTNRPYFLMVGFHKPHSPFNAPKKYWEWNWSISTRPWRSLPISRCRIIWRERV